MTQTGKLGKPTIDLKPGAVRVSKIRRDPPAPAKVRELRTPESEQRESLIVIVGISTFTIALVVAIVGLSDHLF